MDNLATVVGMKEGAKSRSWTKIDVLCRAKKEIDVRSCEVAAVGVAYMLFVVGIEEQSKKVGQSATGRGNASRKTKGRIEWSEQTATGSPSSHVSFL